MATQEGTRRALFPGYPSEPPSEDTLALLCRTSPKAPGIHTLRVPAPISALSIPKPAWHAHGAPTPTEAIYLTRPRLSGLTRLTACITTEPIREPDTTATIRALAAAIAALPALASVTLKSSSTGGRSPWLPSSELLQSHKRRRCGGLIGRAPTLPSLDPVIAALSTAPSLTALTLPWQQTDADWLSTSSLRCPFTALRCLHVVFDECMATAPRAGLDVQPLGLGPLPMLRELRAEVRVRAMETNASAAATVAASHQPALQLLDIHGAAFPAAAEASVCPAETPAGAAGLRPRLKVWLDLAACLSQQKDGVAPLARLSQLSNLHTFTLSIGKYFTHPGSDTGSEQCLKPLTTLHSLRELEVESAAGALKGVAAAALETLPASELTQLTALSICAGAAAYPQARGIAAKLPGLTRLQRLRVGGIRMRDEAAAGLQACLAQLTNLIQLELVVAPINAAVVQESGACAARMPRLRAGRLAWSVEVRAGWYEGLRELPGWGRYEFKVCVRAAVAAREASECEALRQALNGRGACVSEGCTNIDFGNGNSDS